MRCSWSAWKANVESTTQTILGRAQEDTKSENVEDEKREPGKVQRTNTSVVHRCNAETFLWPSNYTAKSKELTILS